MTSNTGESDNSDQDSDQEERETTEITTLCLTDEAYQFLRDQDGCLQLVVKRSWGIWKSSKQTFEHCVILSEDRLMPQISLRVNINSRLPFPDGTLSSIY